MSLSVLLLLAASCNKLDQSPSNKFTDDSFWTSAARADLVLNMAYGQMFGPDKMWSDEYLSDNMIARRDRNPDERLIRAGSGSSGLNLFATEWRWAYQGIKTCNVFMDKIGLVPGLDGTRRSEMEAQIRFIRAYLYFRLSNFYGAVPFFLKNASLEETKAGGRTPRATILAELHRELDEIIPVLPLSVPASDNGRIRRAAAVMLKARMHLYEGEMAQVASLCKGIIDGDYGSYELFRPATVKYSAYEDLFTSANEFNREIILSYAQIPVQKEWTINDKVPRSTVGAMATMFFPTESLVEEYVDADGNPYTVTGNNPYENRDPRLDATVVRHGSVWRDVADGSATTRIIQIDPDNSSENIDKYRQSNATETGYYVRKWFDPEHRTDMKISTDIIMMRYADVLLMYAEAVNESAPASFDQDVWNITLKPIRERAGFTSNAALEFPAGKTQAEYRRIIRTERRAELALEGLRYYDLMRWKEDTNTLLNKTLYSARFTGSTVPDMLFIYKFDPEKDRLWAVPQNQISNWPALRPQNTGY